MMRLIQLFSIAVVFIVSGSAFSETITLGASLQLTGPLANTGRYYRDGYEFAIAKINEKGGIKVGNVRYKLALKLLDNQSDISLSVRQYVQLLTEDKVNFLLGPYASNFALATSSVSEKYQVPMVQGGGASDQIFSRGYKYIFGTLPVASEYFSSTIAATEKFNPKPEKVALLFADDAFDVSVADGTRDILSKAGYKLVLDKRYAANTSDFNSLLSLIKESQADAILVAGHETEILNFIRQAKSLNVSPKFYSFTVGVPTEDFRKALGKDADYAFGMTSWLPTAALKDSYFVNGEAFAKEYAARFGYDPDYHAASAVADVEAFAKAIEAAGTLDPSKVRDAIAHISFDSLYGHVQFSTAGQISLPQIMIQIQNGKLVPIYGQNGFINSPIYPMPSWDRR